MSKINASVLALAPWLLAGVAATQTTTNVVVPATAAASEGNTFAMYPFGYDRVNHVQLIGASVLAGRLPPNKTITAIAYRRDAKVFPITTLKRISGTTKPTPTWSIRMGNLDTTVASGKAFDPRNPLNAFPRPGTTANTLTTVMSQAVNLPDLPPPLTATAPFAISFPLAKPFVYTGPSGLIVNHFAYETRGRTYAYYVDAVRSKTDFGSTKPYGVSCPKANNRAFGISSHPGGPPASLLLFDGPPSSVAVAILGQSRTTWLGQSLPANLAAAGLTGCWLNASMEITIPILTFSNGSANLSLEIPADSQFAGLKAYDQWFAIDSRVSSTLPLTWSNGVEFALGKTVGGPSLEASTIYGVQNLANGRYGFIEKGFMLATRFTYK